MRRVAVWVRQRSDSSAILWVVAALVGAVVGAMGSPAWACQGDCSGDRIVTVGELLTGIDIALGTADMGRCPSFDQDSDLSVNLDELVGAVRSAVSGCPRPLFTDVASAAGLEYLQHRGHEEWLFTYRDWYPQALFTGGAAAGDFDNDGWVDLYVTRLDAPPILFHNVGDGTFADVTVAAGLATPSAWSNGAAWCDIDNDGDRDLYVTAFGPEETRFYLFLNDGAGHFTEEAIPRGAAVEGPDPHYGFGITCADYDNDGWLDIHVGDFRWPFLNPTHALSNARLLHNRGAAAPGSFDDVTVAAGVAMDGVPVTDPRMAGGVYPWTPRFADLDDDGWPDLALTADFGTSRLFWNNHDGTFSDGTAAAGVSKEENGMGAAIGDYDGDGRLDWFVTGTYDPACTACIVGTAGNRLYRNEGGRVFSDQTDALGVRKGAWGWGTAFWDSDNDADLDLVMTNGYDLFFFYTGHDPLRPDLYYYNDPMRFWRNDGGVLAEVSYTVGLTDRGNGRGLLTFDYDRDGDLDLFIVNNGGLPLLYRNESGAENGWLRVIAVGRDSNRDGIGARVTVTPVLGGTSQMREIDAGSHFLGQSELTAHFGLGPGTAPVAEVRVDWPTTGRSQSFASVPRNTTLTAVEPSGDAGAVGATRSR